MKPVPGADLAAMNPPRRRCGKGERGEPSRYVLVALSALVPSHCAPVCAPSQAPAVLVRLAMLYVHDEAPYDVVRLLRLSGALSLRWLVPLLRRLLPYSGFSIPLFR